MAYYDNAGLYRKYGTEKVVVNKAGELRNPGDIREIILKIDLTTLDQTEAIQSDQIWVPKGARIVEIETFAQTGAATGTAIDLGLIQADRATEIDYDGFLAAAVTANMNTSGERSFYRVAVTVPTGLTGTGALVGTNTGTTSPGYITCSRTDGTAFTAGVIIVTIRYYMP